MEAEVASFYSQVPVMNDVIAPSKWHSSRHCPPSPARPAWLDERTYHVPSRPTRRPTHGHYSVFPFRRLRSVTMVSIERCFGTFLFIATEWRYPLSCIKDMHVDVTLRGVSSLCAVDGSLHGKNEQRNKIRAWRWKTCRTWLYKPHKYWSEFNENIATLLYRHHLVQHTFNGHRVNDVWPACGAFTAVNINENSVVIIINTHFQVFFVNVTSRKLLSV